MMTRAAIFVLALAACRADPPPKPPDPDLEIKKMPVQTVPTSAPVAVAAPRTERWAGTCGSHDAGNPAPAVSAARTTPGNVTVVYFWATWCGPCQRDFPIYQDLYAKNKARGLDVVAISVDDERDHLADYAKQNKATFTIGWDENKTDAQCWHLDMLPDTYVVDRAGVIRFVHEGSSTGSAEKVAEEVESLL